MNKSLTMTLRTINLLCFIFFTLSIKANPKIPFQVINFNTIQEEAEKKNKVFFVFFYGDRCVPCEMMKENTFNNPDIIQKVSKDFIAVKIRLDSPLGLDWQMNIPSSVKYIPTIVFFTPQGKMINKYEEWLIPSKFDGVLNDNLFLGNGRVVKNKVFPASYKSNSKKKTTTKKSRAIIAERKTKRSNELVVVIKSFYRIEGVKNYIEKAKAQTNRKNIRYLIDELGERKMYRVIAGKYNSAVAANRIVQELKKSGVEATLIRM